MKLQNSFQLMEFSMCCDSLHADVGSVQRICSRRGCNKHGNTRYCVCVWNHKLKRDSQGPTGCRVTSNQRSAALRCPCSTSLDHQFTCSLVLYLIFFSLRSDLSFHPSLCPSFRPPPVSHTDRRNSSLSHGSPAATLGGLLLQERYITPGVLHSEELRAH